MISAKVKKKYSRYLSENEELKFVTSYSSLHLREQALIYFLFPGMIFVFAGLGIGYLTKIEPLIGVIGGIIVNLIITIILTIIMSYSHKYILTTRRVIVKEGFLKIKLASVLYDKITHITVDQDFLERIILKYGTIRIDTAGSSGDELTLRFIEEPIQFKNKLETLIHEHSSPKKKKKMLMRPFEEDFIKLNKRK